MATFTLPPKSSRSNLCLGWKRTWVMWSRTTPPDKPTETDTPPQTCPRNTLFDVLSTTTRVASPPTMGLSPVAKQSPGRSTRECLAPPTRDPPSSTQLRYQWARPRPSSSTSYHCARGERIPTDLARETPSPAPPSPPTLRAGLRGARDQIKRTSGTTGTIVTAGTILQCDGTELPIVLYSAYSP